jgi:hypothetical protein
MHKTLLEEQDDAERHVMEAIVATAPDVIAHRKATRRQEAKTKAQQSNSMQQQQQQQHQDADPDEYADLDVDEQPNIIHPAPIVLQRQADQDDDAWDILCREVPASSTSTRRKVSEEEEEEVEEQKEMQARGVVLRCMYDGHVFDGDVFTFPIEQMSAGAYRLSRMPFCSLSCTKAYLRNNDYDTTLLVNFVNYAAHKYSIHNVETAPSRNRLACYDMQGIGLTIEEFRRHKMGKSDLRKLDARHAGMVDVNIFECLAQTTFLPLIVDRRALKQEEYASAVVLANKRKRNKIMPIVSALESLLLSNTEETEEHAPMQDGLLVPQLDETGGTLDACSSSRTLFSN